MAESAFCTLKVKSYVEKVNHTETVKGTYC